MGVLIVTVRAAYGRAMKRSLIVWRAGAHPSVGYEVNAVLSEKRSKDPGHAPTPAEGGGKAKDPTVLSSGGGP
jgi:hypothetical protein